METSVAIIGATGKTGKWALKGALQRGHRVKVLARNPAKIESVLKSIFPETDDVTEYSQRVTAVKGDATDLAQLAELCQDVQIVMSFLGMVDGKTWIVKPGVEAVMKAMKSLPRPPKFLSMSSIGLGDSRAQANKAWCCCTVRLTIDFFLKECFNDMQAAEDYILANKEGLNVTIVRASILADKKNYFKDYNSPLKSYKLEQADMYKKLTMTVDRQHVAEAFLDIGVSNDYDNMEISVFETDKKKSGAVKPTPVGKLTE